MTSNHARLSLVTFGLMLAAVPAAAQTRTPSVTLSPAPVMTLPGSVDSNSPAVWDLVDGVTTLHVLTSFAGVPSLQSGPRLAELGAPTPVTFVTHPGYGVWMESVVLDEGGTWYGYYHNEVPSPGCRRPELVLPRVGAARSRDQGATWEASGSFSRRRLAGTRARRRIGISPAASAT